MQSVVQTGVGQTDRFVVQTPQLSGRVFQVPDEWNIRGAKDPRGKRSNQTQEFTLGAET